MNVFLWAYFLLQTKAAYCLTLTGDPWETNSSILVQNLQENIPLDLTSTKKDPVRPLLGVHRQAICSSYQGMSVCAQP